MQAMTCRESDVGSPRDHAAWPVNGGGRWPRLRRGARLARRGLCVVLCSVLCASGLLVSPAGAQGADRDKALADQLARWEARHFELPPSLPLDPALRQEAQALAQAHLARTRPLWDQWVVDERRVPGSDEARQAFRNLALRAMNEWMLVSIDSAGPSHDKAWLTAALAPRACAELPAPFFARRIALIQAAPEADRPALLAAERTLLSRWGQKRQDLNWQPAALDLGAAEQAVARLASGLTVDALPMSPFLAATAFAHGRPAGQADPWARCALGQWWVSSQRASGRIADAQAVAALRVLHAQDATVFGAPEAVMKAQAAHDAGQAVTYPPLATHFEVQGRTVAEVQVDAAGQVLAVRVVERDLRVPGVRDNPPLAFEALLDGITVRGARQRTFAKGRAGPQRVEFFWRLE